LAKVILRCTVSETSKLQLKVTKLFGETMKSIITNQNSISLWSGRVFGRFSAHGKCLETSENFHTTEQELNSKYLDNFKRHNWYKI